MLKPVLAAGKNNLLLGYAGRRMGGSAAMFIADLAVAADAYLCNAPPKAMPDSGPVTGVVVYKGLHAFRPMLFHQIRQPL